MRASRALREAAIDGLFDASSRCGREGSVRSGERCSRVRMGEVTRSVDSTCSNLNLSLQAMSGRQTSWSVATTMSMTVAMPPRGRGCRRSPWRSGCSCRGRASWKLRSPMVNISQKIRAEPAAGDGDDGVPDQADGGVGQLKLPEALPRGVAVDARGFAASRGEWF